LKIEHGELKRLEIPIRPPLEGELGGGKVNFSLKVKRINQKRIEVFGESLKGRQ